MAWYATEPPVRWKRVLSLVLGTCGTAVILVTLAATHNPRNYLYVRLLAAPEIGIPVGVCLLLAAVAPRLPEIPRFPVLVLLTILTIPTCVGGAVFVPMHASSFDHTIVATSPRFKLVEYVHPGAFSSGSACLRLRSQAGLLSREGSEDIACFAVPQSGASGEWLFARAAFQVDNAVNLVSPDGHEWVVRFNPDTLRTDQVLDRRTGAPDQMLD